jgi:anaerobic ribonucleoside-triphosphate reductase activating protein
VYFNLLGETYPTTVNGPGERYMIHLQGCNLGCVGCFNPESWSFKENKLVDIYKLADRITVCNPEGLTISGGEPFLQPKPLLEFIKYFDKSFQKGILIYSGLYEEELKKIPEYEEILDYVCVIVSGRYDQTKRIHNSLLSSSNQKFIWGKNPKIFEEELQNQKFEIIEQNSEFILTGFPPINQQFKEDLKELGVEIKGIR